MPMSRPPPCPVLLCADSAAASPLCMALEQAGFQVAVTDLEEANRLNGSAAQLILIDGGSRPEAALRLCQELRDRAEDGFVPVLFLAYAEAPRRAALESGADAVLAWPGDAAD